MKRKLEAFQRKKDEDRLKKQKLHGQVNKANSSKGSAQPTAADKKSGKSGKSSMKHAKVDKVEHVRTNIENLPAEEDNGLKKSKSLLNENKFEHLGLSSEDVRRLASTSTG